MAYINGNEILFSSTITIEEAEIDQETETLLLQINEGGLE